MDVLLSTGEQSGDILEREVTEHLQALSGRTLDIAAVGGRRTLAHGVRGLVDPTRLATLGVEPDKLRLWRQVLKYTIALLQKDPPKVFIGITHHLFNYILAENLPKTTYRIMVEPPEAWGWQASDLTRGVASILNAPAARSVSKRHALHLVANRDSACLERFNRVFCCTQLTRQYYEALAKDMPTALAQVEYVGRPEARLRRSEDDRESLQIRQHLGIPPDHHILSVFPGSRERNVRELLPTMLRAVRGILERHRYVTAVVSVADPGFVQDVEPILKKEWPAWPATPRVITTYTDEAAPLLCASSHAVLSSGTITLQAAVLGVHATVGYDLGIRAERWRSRIFPYLTRALLARHCFVQPGNKTPMPFALPNAIVAVESNETVEPPYDECCLEQFDARRIQDSIEKRMFACGEERYSPEVHRAHLRLSPEMVERVRDGVRPPPPIAEGDSMKRVAEVAWQEIQKARNV